MDFDEFTDLESRLVGVVSGPILGAVSVGNHRVRASDFNFLYAALNGTKSRPESNFPSDRFRPKAAISLTVDAIGIGRIFG
jgi:hypothetical protein